MKYRFSKYRLTILKDWINDRMAEIKAAALEEITAETGTAPGAAVAEEAEIMAEIMQDIVVIIAVEEKNDRIVRVSLEEPIAVSAGTKEHKIEIGQKY